MSQFPGTFYEGRFEGGKIMETELLALDTGHADSESINTTFRAAHSTQRGANAIGVLLTGMGDNGAKTLVQDEKSSVVWGMRGEAYKIGAASDQCPLEHIAKELLKHAQD